MKQSILAILVIFSIKIMAQSDSTKTIQFSGYAELYYSYDFANPAQHDKPNFIYNHKRHNELNINLAYIKAAYLQQKVRGNLALMVGNYAQYNLASEPNWAQFVYEANLGVKLSSKQNIWLDAGIIPSHLGFESAVGADCWTLSRSMVAENSPYYETGLKFSYTNKKENLQLAFLMLNGWQHIRRPDAIQTPSCGIQLNYKPSSKLTLNYSNFIGTDKPDSLNAIRTYHNFYGIYEPSSRFGLIAGLDVGTEKLASSNAIWFTPVIIGRFSLGSKAKVALRVEYFRDSKQIVLSTNTPNGFQTLSTSINVDYQIQELVLLRAEMRNYSSKDAIFLKDNKWVQSNHCATLSICAKF